MSNFNCTNNSINNSIGVANQLKFITWCQNNGMQNMQAGAPPVSQSATPPINQPANFANTQNAPQYQHTINQDTASFLNDKYAADDGKISAKEKLLNFGKGVISPVTMMFSSPKNFALGAAGIIGSGLLIAATGGAAAPVMVAAGVAGGAVGLLKSGYNALTAKTDDEARKAWQGLGLGTTVTAGSIAGSKAALKGAGIDTKNMNVLSATVECFKNAPAQIGKSVNIFKSGEALLNIKNVLHIKNKDTKGTGNTDETGIKPKKTEGDAAVNAPEAAAADADNIPLNGDDAAAGMDTPETDIKPVQPKKVSKPRRRRPSRIKREVPKEQAQKVEQEVKSISQILDDIVENNDVDSQFKLTVENLKEIAQNPMEQPKYDKKALMNAIKQIEGCRDCSANAANGQKPDSIFNEAISYIEKLLSGEYKIDRLQAKAGDVFDSKTMYALELVPTKNSELNNTVSKMLFSGFRKQGSPNPISGYTIKVAKYTTEN